MQSSSRTALAAILLSVNAAVACPPGYHRHSYTAPWAWTSALTALSPAATSSEVVVVPTSTAAATTSLEASSSSTAVYTPSTVTTSEIPAVTVTSTSSEAVVTPSTTAVVTPSTTSSAAAAPTTSAASTTDSTLTADQSSALDSQNSARSDVGEAALTWNATLATNAQTWADHLASLNDGGTLIHSDTTTEGENLYWQSNSDSPFAAAASAWVGEKSLYDGEAITGTGGFESYGHYSMLDPEHPAVEPGIGVGTPRD